MAFALSFEPLRVKRVPSDRTEFQRCTALGKAAEPPASRSHLIAPFEGHANKKTGELLPILSRGPLFRRQNRHRRRFRPA